jgi:hypothetical protein
MLGIGVSRDEQNEAKHNHKALHLNLNLTREKQSRENG